MPRDPWSDERTSPWERPSARHDAHDAHDAHDVHDVDDAQDVQDVIRRKLADAARASALKHAAAKAAREAGISLPQARPGQQSEDETGQSTITRTSSRASTGHGFGSQHTYLASSRPRPPRPPHIDTDTDTDGEDDEPRTGVQATIPRAPAPSADPPPAARAASSRQPPSPPAASRALNRTIVSSSPPPVPGHFARPRPADPILRGNVPERPLGRTLVDPRATTPVPSAARAFDRTLGGVSGSPAGDAPITVPTDELPRTRPPATPDRGRTRIGSSADETVRPPRTQTLIHPPAPARGSAGDPQSAADPQPTAARDTSPRMRFPRERLHRSTPHSASLATNDGASRIQLRPPPGSQQTAPGTRAAEQRQAAAARAPAPGPVVGSAPSTAPLWRNPAAAGGSAPHEPSFAAQTPFAVDPAPAQLVAEAFGEQMVDLLERARRSEARAVDAERQLAALRFESHALLPAGPSSPEPRGPSGLVTWGGWALSGVLLAAGAAGYLSAYAPLAGELASARKAYQDQATAQSEGTAALRAEFARERQAMEEQLSAARQAASAAAAAAQPAAAEPEPLALAAEPEPRSARARASDDGDDADAARERTPEQEARREARLAAREARRAEREAKREERAAKREERAQARAERNAAARADDDEPASPRAKTSEAARDDSAEPARPAAAPEESGDDPLEGLDGF